jgi:hypothetical protein
MLNEDKYEGIPTFSGVEELADTAPFLTIDKTRGEHYRHFLKKTDAAEICRFEDYFAHNRYTQMAVLNYPFKFLPFLHVDPRRIWGELDTDKHDFYCETGSNNELEQLNKETIKQNIDNT